ncbi:MAG TPA: CPBP family intramembrane glutamic endopeptidase [Pirellulales bacterium]|nr:CPBP family intramembrane glutamic endopeptidase [Pirellulales bacterium]
MPPADAPLPLAIKLLIGAVVSLGLLTALFVAIKAWRRPPLLPYEPRRPVPWGANDLVLTVLFIFVIGYAGAQLTAHVQGAPPAQAGQESNTVSVNGYYIGSLAELAGVAIAIYLMRLVANATLSDLGFGIRRLGRDIGVGAVALLASAVPIYGLNELLTRYVKYTHQVLKSLESQPDVRMFVATAVAALVVAPLFEEFLFRVLLQGWFEKIESLRRMLRLGLPGEGPAWWPIVLSSFLWAIMHWQNGLAAVPLFFFGLVLGYLYQRSHRIWPSMTTHFLLNATTMTALWFQIHHGH